MIYVVSSSKGVGGYDSDRPISAHTDVDQAAAAAARLDHGMVTALTVTPPPVSESANAVAIAAYFRPKDISDALYELAAEEACNADWYAHML